MRQRKHLFAPLALLLLFAACKSESPTSPSTGTQSPTPPTGATVALTASNANPLVSSTSVITATVTQNGQPVPNGTAVQFATTIGTFTDPGSAGATIIRTTTNGIATATLTSASPGAATVTATVNNVTQRTTVTFASSPVTPPPPNTTPTITSITPSTIGPAGGTITINGTNFRQPLRVIVKCEGNVATTPPDASACSGQTEKDAFVSSVTPTQIIAVVPAFNVIAGQALSFTVTVISSAGTTSEQSAALAAGITFTSPSLTPAIVAVSPISGPLEGGTQITIHGSGFQSPVQVTFGTNGTAAGPLTSSVELQVIRVNFSEIVAVTPELRLIDPLLNLSTSEVALRVVNINSGTAGILAGAFHYLPRVHITNFTPASASAIGGGQITIDGIGFDDPVSVIVSGTVAQVIRVSGTEIVARLGIPASPCSTAANVGPVIVTNVNTGDQSTSLQTFTYIPVSPSISTSPLTATPGNSITVGVTNPGVGPLGTATVQFSAGTSTIVPTPSVISTGSGTQNFSVLIPSNFTFPTVACTTSGGFAGTQSGAADLIFTNTTTSCTTTALGLLLPPGPNTCLTPPTATVTSPAQTCPAPNLTPPAPVAAGANTHSATITITNASAAQPLILGAPTVSASTNTAAPVVSPSGGATIPAGGSTSYTVTLDPTAVGPDNATITFTSNDPTKPTITVTVCGSGT